MADVNLSLLGGLVRGFAPVMSPILDEFEVMKYIRQPLKPATEDFRILLNVSYFQPHEIEITVLKNRTVKICAKHVRRQNADGIWVTRDWEYKYELPDNIAVKEIQAQWYEDNFLVIQATSSKCDEGVPEDLRLVPERVSSLLKPNIEISVVKRMMEDIKNRAVYALRYMEFQSHSASPVGSKTSTVVSQVQSSTESSSDVSPVDPSNEGAGSTKKDLGNR